MDKGTTMYCRKVFKDGVEVSSENFVSVGESITERFKKIIDDLTKTFVAKNTDYGNNSFDNIRRCERIGIAASLGCFIRMGDKWGRLENWFKNRDRALSVKDESAIDTLKDLAIYCIIQIMLLEDESTKATPDTLTIIPTPKGPWKVGYMNCEGSPTQCYDKKVSINQALEVLDKFS